MHARPRTYSRRGLGGRGALHTLLATVARGLPGMRRRQRGLDGSPLQRGRNDSVVSGEVAATHASASAALCSARRTFGTVSVSVRRSTGLHLVVVIFDHVPVVELQTRTIRGGGSRSQSQPNPIRDTAARWGPCTFRTPQGGGKRNGVWARAIASRSCRSIMVENANTSARCC